jgi:hypothetical protein
MRVVLLVTEVWLSVDVVLAAAWLGIRAVGRRASVAEMVRDAERHANRATRLTVRS